MRPSARGFLRVDVALELCARGWAGPPEPELYRGSADRLGLVLIGLALVEPRPVFSS